MAAEISPEVCDIVNRVLDDALLGKKIRQMVENGEVSEILHDAITDYAKYGIDRYDFISYVDLRLREVLPLERTTHEHV